MKSTSHTIGGHKVEIIQRGRWFHVIIDDMPMRSRCGYPDEQEAYDEAKYEIAIRASRPNLID
jgi:hypothetical protein